MALIPKEFITDLVNRIDIVELIDARVPLKKSGHNYSACCPFHNEKTPSFTVSQSKQFFHCFGCGKHGNAITFLMDYDRIDFVDAVETLAAQLGIPVPKEQRSGQANQGQQHDFYTLIRKAAKFYYLALQQHPHAQNYLESRGIDDKVIKQFALGYAPNAWDSMSQLFNQDRIPQQTLLSTGILTQNEQGKMYDRFRDRIIFPIRDRRGRMLGFGGRTLGDGTPKYLNSPETPIFHKGSELYGLYEALQANRELNEAIIVEGYMDVIALSQFGVTNAVATLGTATTKHHLERLFKVTQRVIFCFDGDNAGKQAAWRALENSLSLLQDGRQIRFMFLPDGEDPDSLIRQQGPSGFQHYIDSAMELAEFFIQHLAQQVDLSHLDGRAQLIKLAQPLVQLLPAGIYQKLVCERLGKLSRLNPQQIQQHLFNSSNEITPTTKKQQQFRPTPMRIAIALLVQNPQLYQCINEKLPSISQLTPGAKLFSDVVEFIEKNPTINTAGLLENWRDHQDYTVLAKLACWEHTLPEDGIEAEFMGALQRIRISGHEEQIEALLAKASLGTLSDTEKSQLQQLIADTKIEGQQ